MSKKKVTAPLTYDPGKGRPKEHLAYLNWQEMEALKRLNGNNQERGPKGLPSFPPADAIGSSSKASSKSPSKSTGGKMGSSSSQSGGVKKSSQDNVGAQKASTSTKIGSAVSGAQKGMGAAKASAAAKIPSGGRTGFSGAGQNAADAKVKAEVAKRDAVKISRESPAYRADTAKKGIGSLGFSQQFEAKPGAKVKGAIEAQKEQMYRPAPRYTQPQAQRMMNPTAIPSMERTAAERVNAMYAERERAAKAMAQVARAGPFGAPGYTGRYDPKTGRYDAKPIAAPSSVAMDPSVAGRLAQANQNYKTVTGPGGMVSRVYSDPDIRGRTLGDVVTDYGKYAYDTIGGALTAAGDYIGLPDKPVMPSGQSMLNDFYEAVRAKPQAPKPIQDRLPSEYSPMPIDNRAYAGLLSGVDPYSVGDIAVRNAISAPGGPPSLDEQLRFHESLIGSGVGKAMNPVSQINSLSGYASPATQKPANFSWEGVRPYDIRVTAPPASGIDLRAPAKTRSVSVEPTGYEQPGEKFLSVENVPESTSSFVGMSDSEIKKTLKDLGYPSKIYNNPKFARDFIEDPDRLGVVGTGNRKLDPVSMAKLHSEAYGGNYLTPAERAQEVVSSGIERVVNRNPLLKAATETFKELRDIESPKEFLSRPQYEQDYLRDLAKAEAIQYGRSPFVEGDRGGGGSDRGGIAALTVPTRTVAPSPTESTTGTTTKVGPRPEIYYYWDLGVNIPSPTDPNYTQYQTYLRERAAAQAAMYG